MKEFIKKIAGKFGYDIKKRPYDQDKIKFDILVKRKINLVLDVGANVGQYTSYLRSIGYSGKVISFEPLMKEFQLLKQNSEKDANWQVNNFAFGDKIGMERINIAGNSFSSSLLSMADEHLVSAPHSKYVDSQEIQVKTLDNFFEENPWVNSHNIFLKLDVQGFEKNVIKGALNSLKNISGLQLELSVTELYKGETLFFEMVEYLKQFNFELSYVESGFMNPETLKLLQVDAFFLKI